MHIAHTRIGSVRGRLRLWLEGPRLSLVSFAPGTRFKLHSDPANHKLVLKLDANGERAVSGRVRKAGGIMRPIIDITGSLLERIFPSSAEQVRVIYRDAEIEVVLPPIAVAQAKREEEVRERLREGKPLSVGTLCIGAGVIDHAVHSGLGEAGIQTEAALAVDIDPESLEVALTANPATKGCRMTIEASIDEIEPEIMPRLSILLAGLPCTAASVAGRARKRLAMPEDDEQAGHLCHAYLQLLRASQAPVTVIENVPQYASTASAAIIRRQLRAMRYRVFEIPLFGPDFGALEARHRWTLIGISEGIAPETLEVPAEPGPVRRLGEVLEDVPAGDPRWQDHAYLDRHAEQQAAKGNNFKRNLVTADAQQVGTIGKGYWKHRTSEPAIQSPYDPALSRLLTPAEHAEVKSLPRELADAILHGRSATSAHELLGQSAVWSCFKALGKALGKVLAPLTISHDAAPSRMARPLVRPVELHAQSARPFLTKKQPVGLGQLAFAW
ncbi:DNA cytosine methyltransferase [Azospirillum sp. SYSU D00513]|uniref:DNA cytosine methyltransferase n=1 Tax=Azospirillum sp. SYSU D00513 TaxID=2812561 RepID=UPI001A957621|nr:DNA cytosine methyltransferase [Azospirillum sp. SYSU D00513]